ncbi:MAG: sulfotransferase family protein [Microthrixaceae bacterium]
METGSDRPILVVGCARSGTTLLQMMLNAHPAVAMPAETRFVLGLHRGRVRFGDLRSSENLDRARAFILRPESLLASTDINMQEVGSALQASPRTVGSLSGSVFAAYAAQQGKRRWGDKRPSYIRHVPTLLELFPDAQIVHIIRDGRDCVASLTNMPWWSDGAIGATHKWREAMIEAARLRSTLPTASYYEIRYESLTASPETELAKLCGYLGEQPSTAMFDFHESGTVAPWRTWHEATKRPVNSEAAHRWQTDLPAPHLALVEQVCGRQLEAAGYELSGHRLAVAADVMDEWRDYKKQRRKALKRRTRRERGRSEEYPHPLAAALTTGQRQAARASGWFDDYAAPQPPTTRRSRLLTALPKPGRRKE